MKGPDQGLLTARVVPSQLTRFETVVGHVASTTAGDPDLVQQLRGLLEDQHRLSGILCAGDRGEEAGGATTDDDVVDLHPRSL
jgi:hypothetical protein